MKKAVQFRFWLCMVLVVLLALVITTPQSSRAQKSGGRVEGELLVKFGGDATSKSASVANNSVGASVIEEFPSIGWQHVRLPEGMSVDEGLARYCNLPGVVSAQPNYIYRTLATPNDPDFSQMYGMTKIQAPAAWDMATGSSSVVVAVIDTGVLYTHEDLSVNMWKNPGETGLDSQGHDKASNGIDDDTDGYVDDVYGADTYNNDGDPLADSSGGFAFHGTHTAGTIGAAGNNGKGVVGVNWSVSLMAVKSHAGSGDSTSAKVIAAFQYVTMMRQRGVNVRVTNSSWGGAPEAGGFDQALKDAIDAAGNAGIINVFAAGNGANNNDATPFYPASYDSPSIVSVAASDQNDNPASFTNYGATTVDLAAPGVSILSTWGPTASDYASSSGTSMAAPHVAGAAALLAAINPSLTVASIKSILINTVDQSAQWSGKVVSSGRLNLAHAVQSALPTASSPVINGRITTSDGAPLGGVVVTLSGSQSAHAITNASGSYRFDNVVASGFYTITPARVNYEFTPASRSFSVAGSSADAPFMAQPTAETANPLDTAEFFVREQYLDFLGREPDQGGLDFWSAKLSACGADARCLSRERASVASAFFMSYEFQESGYFVYRLYKAALGRRPDFDEESADRAKVSVGADRAAFADAFVERAEFLGKYGSATTAESFVDALVQTVLQSSGVDLSGQRDALLASYGAGMSVAQSRSLALRSAIEEDSFKQAEYNRAFVLMQYFGYLKRNPDEGGYSFWVDVLNNRVAGNYQSMTCAFITSAEYQRRFSPIVTRTNSECL